MPVSETVLTQLLWPFCAFTLVMLLIMPAIKLARVVGIIDHPEGRKQHDKAVPPIGGLIVFPVFMILAMFAGVDFQKDWPLYVSLVLLLMTGAIDDRFQIHAWIKFFIHALSAVIIVVFGGVQVMYLGDLFPWYGDVVWVGAITIPFTIIAVVLLVNALNLIDGMDGLAGGVAVVMLSFLVCASLFAGGAYLRDASMILVLIGALLGFLVFNMRNPWRRKAALFLGDAGSMCLGLSIAWFSVRLAQFPETPMSPVSVAWIIGLPIMDACAQFYRRVRNGRDPFAPDRGHIHHNFIDAGITTRRAAPIIIAIVFLMGVIGYGGVALGVHEGILLALWGVCLLIHMALSYRPERYARLIARGFFFAVEKEGG